MAESERVGGMSITRRLRILKAALTQRWHVHHCNCGEVWYCMAPQMCGWSPVHHDQCQHCEGLAHAQWMIQQAQQERQKGSVQ
jgi:hypothetical protein